MRRMTQSLVIPADVNGPPDSANGGYACGVLASLLAAPSGDGATVQATLRQPPPLGRPLDGAVSDDGSRATLHDGDTLIGEAVVVGAEAVASGTPAPITLDEARAVAAGFADDRYFTRHPFPTCFTCGPDRTGTGGDGLRLFPGRVRPHVVAWPWEPEAALAKVDDLVGRPYVWAALDCPSGLCWWHDDPDAPPHVLGRMTAVVHRLPSPGEPLVVAGWSITGEGRKRQTGSVIWDADGAVVADNRSTWIALDARTAATFRPTNPPT
jgi:hypothetical protein